MSLNYLKNHLFLKTQNYLMNHLYQQ
jgi:hypothetical protein